jgi:Domain of unknown function (DUF4124)
VRLRQALLLLCLAVEAASASQVLYRFLDKEGRVVVSDRPPAQGPYERIDSDLNTNIIQSPRRSSDQPGAAGSQMVRQRQQQRDSLRAAVDAARKRLEEAQAALVAGRDPREGEWRPVQVRPDNNGKPNAQGQVTAQGGRVICPIDPYGKPVCVSGNSPNEEYFKRIEKLESDLRKAEELLRDAEQNYRRNAPD